MRDLFILGDQLIAVPEWFYTTLILLGKAVVILAIAPVCMMYMTWLERKVMARIQDRIGPNRVGPFGLLQPLADGIKMLTKEDVMPKDCDKLCHFLGPMLIVVPSLYLFTVIPVAPNVVAAPLATGLLFFVAIGSVTALALFVSAWGSRSKFSVFGAIRNAAQVIAYEIPMLLGLAVVPMLVGSLAMQDIVSDQLIRWHLFTPWGFFGFILVFLTGLAEVNRTPFDLPEAESELVGGFHTEFSGMKFALLYMAEFLGTLAMSALLVILFLGGWSGPQLPFLPATVSAILWMSLKTFALVFTMIWIRGTWPRLRMDQVMSFAWKVLIPVALANLVGAALWYTYSGFLGVLAGILLPLVTFMLTSQVWLKPKPVHLAHWAEI